jgi:uncharacterized membrane protein
VAAITSCDIIFWFWLSEKILKLSEKWQNNQSISGNNVFEKLLIKFGRWLAELHRSYAKHQDKKFVKRLRALGCLGLYCFGIIPSLTAFFIGISIQKLFIQSRYGLWCLWLGVMTRIAVSTFVGLKLAEFLIKPT